MTEDPVKLTYAEYEDLCARLRSATDLANAYSDALKKLKEAAQEVVEHRDDDDLDSLQDSISGLEESIPCDDCLQAPCRCP